MLIPHHRTWICLIALLLGIPLGLSVHAANHAANRDGGSKVVAAAPSSDFLRLDIDRDGHLSLEEFIASGMDARAFREADANRDERLSPDEFIKAVSIDQRIKTGKYFDDAWITAKVRAMLLKDSLLSGLNIKVETEDGVVRLSGELPRTDQIDRALTIASQVGGVKSIQNKLLLK